MLSSGGTNRSLKTEGFSCSTTGKCLGLDGPSRSIPDSSFDPLRDERSLNLLDFLSEPLGEAGELKDVVTLLFLQLNRACRSLDMI